MQIFLMHVHVPQDLKPQQKIANIYFNAGMQHDLWVELSRQPFNICDSIAFFNMDFGNIVF
jgi:hypothetical protein